MGAEEGAAAGSWDATLEEWMTQGGHCCAAAMAQQDTCEMYAAAPQEGEEGWGLIFKEGPYDGEIRQEDDSLKKISVDESASLKAVADMKDMSQRPENGLWIAGKKYIITSCKEEEVGDSKFVITQAAHKDSRTAVVITKTTTQVIVAMTDENKGQKPGNAINAMLAFAEYLVGLGY